MPLARLLPLVAAATLSASALTALVHLEPPRVQASTQVAAPPRSPRTLPRAATAHPAAAPAPDANADAHAVSVPDFTTKRLSTARREARALGLKLVARDMYGGRVHPDLARYYRVRKQFTAPGSNVAPGGTIEVRVREMASFAAGY